MLTLGHEIAEQFPTFAPHPLLYSGHLQTVAALYTNGYQKPLDPDAIQVELPDGDKVVLMDDKPPQWRETDGAVLLVHGLGGSHQSNYMKRLASRVYERGYRVFRLDQRGCGAGLGLAKHCYHAGRSEDVQLVVERLLSLCPHSPIHVCGFSLGGNVVLRMLGIWGDRIPSRVVSAFVAAPPICLQSCNSNIAGRRLYNNAFRKWLVSHARLRKEFIPEEIFKALRKVRTLNEFDENFVAPLSGFDSANHYYQVASAKPHLHNVAVPTCIVAADDDPLIPIQIFENLPDNPALVMHKTRGGGHVAFIGRGGLDEDRRWMDWRMMTWIDAYNDVWEPIVPASSPAAAMSVAKPRVAAESQVV